MRKLASPSVMVLCVLNRIPMSSDRATWTYYYCLIYSPTISFSSSSSSSSPYLLDAFFSSEFFKMFNIFSENYFTSISVRKVKPSSSSTFCSVLSSVIMISESYSFSMVSTRVLIKTLARLIASWEFYVLTATMRLGRHLQAYSLTSSFGCSLMILHNKLTVFST